LLIDFSNETGVASPRLATRWQHISNTLATQQHTSNTRLATSLERQGEEEEEEEGEFKQLVMNEVDAGRVGWRLQIRRVQHRIIACKEAHTLPNVLLMCC